MAAAVAGGGAPADMAAIRRAAPMGRHPCVASFHIFVEPMSEGTFVFLGRKNGVSVTAGKPPTTSAAMKSCEKTHRLSCQTSASSHFLGIPFEGISMQHRNGKGFQARNSSKAPISAQVTPSKDACVRSRVPPGVEVEVVCKEDQRSGKLTRGIVAEVLTNSSFHPRGVKVRLNGGTIGRVQSILSRSVRESNSGSATAAKLDELSALTGLQPAKRLELPRAAMSGYVEASNSLEVDEKLAKGVSRSSPFAALVDLRAQLVPAVPELLEVSSENSKDFTTEVQFEETVDKETSAGAETDALGKQNVYKPAHVPLQSEGTQSESRNFGSEHIVRDGNEPAVSKQAASRARAGRSINKERAKRAERRIPQGGGSNPFSGMAILKAGFSPVADTAITVADPAITVADGFPVSQSDSWSDNNLDDREELGDERDIDEDAKTQMAELKNSDDLIESRSIGKSEEQKTSGEEEEQDRVNRKHSKHEPTGKAAVANADEDGQEKLGQNGLRRLKKETSTSKSRVREEVKENANNGTQAPRSRLHGRSKVRDQKSEETRNAGEQRGRNKRREESVPLPSATSESTAAKTVLANDVHSDVKGRKFRGDRWTKGSSESDDVMANSTESSTEETDKEAPKESSDVGKPRITGEMILAAMQKVAIEKAKAEEKQKGAGSGNARKERAGASRLEKKVPEGPVKPIQVRPEWAAEISSLKARLEELKRMSV